MAVCLICLCVMDWRPVQGVPRLSPNDGWDRLQSPAALNWIKRVLMDGISQDLVFIMIVILFPIIDFNNISLLLGVIINYSLCMRMGAFLMPL